MILNVLIFGLGFLLLFLIWKLTLGTRPGRCSSGDWDEKELHVDIEVFRLLADKEEELYLRRSLPPAYVRTTLRKRAALAIKCLDTIEDNALLLLKMASAAQGSSDPQIARTARQLVMLTVEVRLNIILAIWYLRLKWLFPMWTTFLPPRLLACDRLIDRGAWLLKSSGVVVPRPADP